MRFLYQGQFVDQSGNVVSDGTITIYLAGTTTLASVYTTLTGPTAVNSVTSDSNGYFKFYHDNFDYDYDQDFDIVLSKSGFLSKTYYNVQGEGILGNYTISTAKTITTNIEIPKGVIYVKSGTGTIAFNGPFEAGLYQVFSGFTTGVTFGTLSGREVYSKWFNDDDQAIASVASATNYILHLTNEIRIVGATSNDLPTYGSEFLSSLGWVPGGNWTGSWDIGWTHINMPNTSAIQQTTTPVIGTRYRIVYTVTNRTVGTFDIHFGGDVLNTVSATGVFYLIATDNTDFLTISPSLTFDGTIVISIKPITAGSSSILTLLSSNKTIQLEMRANTATENTFIGKNAGKYNIEGSYNTGIGSGALYNNNDGESNVAVGTAALVSNIRGPQNVAIGRESLFSNTEGNNNVALGFRTLWLNTTGYYNMAIGTQALYANTVGANNIANGFQSLVKNTTGEWNTAIGSFSLAFNITGSFNTAYGAFALYNSAPAGTRNTGIGAYTLLVTTGNYNTAVGDAALINIVAGNDNTAVGREAGAYIAGVPDPQNTGTKNNESTKSLFLGANTKALVNGGTNEIVIGTDVTGLGSDTAIIGSSAINTFGFGAHKIAWLSAAPTGGTWMISDRIFNSVATVGQPKGWICNASGTFSAATENGTATSGSPTITAMVDTSDFAVGQYVNASAQFAVLTALKILSITATSITVDRNANGTGAVTLTTSDPTFVSEGNL